MSVQQLICSCQPRFHFGGSGLTKSALWGRITPLQPRTGTNLQRAVCSAGRLEEAERHSRGQERAADKPTSLKSIDKWKHNVIRRQG